MNQKTALIASGGVFEASTPSERFAAIQESESAEGQKILAQIAQKIAETRRPGALSDIPAGVTYLTQFVVHDLDFLTREGTAEASLLDLAILYGDGPKHDAFCYQIPTEPGRPRFLLRLGRTRPTSKSPAWGARRDLPRESCPHLDAKGVETKTEVMVPNAFSDNNVLFGQMQTLWALTHNAIATVLVETLHPREAFDQAREINRGIYRDVILNDILGHWLIERLRPRYQRIPSRDTNRRPGRAPREFMAGVGRLGHGLVREIYTLNLQRPLVGLRDAIKHTSTSRPDQMPLTEDWLLDFSNFFAINSSPQKARAIGPHVARPIAHGAGLAAGDPATDTIVLRDLMACTRGDLCSVQTLIKRARDTDPCVFDGSFAQDEGLWVGKLRAWLLEAGIEEGMADRLAADPPLTLFLMLEAEHDTDGKSLGVLGSILMGETLTDALPDVVADPALDASRSLVFKGPAPTNMADLIRFLQRHYQFAEGARLHPAETKVKAATGETSKPKSGDTMMLDSSSSTKQPISRIEVTDYIEMGRLVARWSTEPKSQPKDIEELKQQFDGIATVPDRIKHIHIVQGTLDTLILRLPVKEMIEESLERMSDPMANGDYPLPQFYHDYYNPGFGPVMSSLDTLLARVGDYTIAQCK